MDGDYVGLRIAATWLVPLSPFQLGAHENVVSPTDAPGLTHFVIPLPAISIYQLPSGSNLYCPLAVHSLYR